MPLSVRLFTARRDDENALRDAARWSGALTPGAEAEPSEAAVPRRACVLRSGRGTGQEIAAVTSSTTFFSTTELHFSSAYDTGHMSPSSSVAASWKPKVEYR